MPDYILDNEPPRHVHPFTEVTQLVAWQGSVERSLATKARDIETLKRCVLWLFVFVCVLGFAMLITIG